MFDALKRGLGQLTIFQGREPRRQFWPYVGWIYLIHFVVMQIVMTPIMLVMMSEMMADMMRVTATLSEVTDPAVVNAQMAELMSKTFLPLLGPLVAISLVSLAVMVALMAAAVTRRLHDMGQPGWWGVLPLPFTAASMIATPMMFGSFSSDFFNGLPDESFFMWLFANLICSGLYMIALIILIALLAQPTKPGANRYGEAP